jgi:type IV secretory pathway VirB10-like protein
MGENNMEESHALNPAPLPLRAKPPRPVSGLNKRTVISAAAILVCLVGVSIIVAFSPSEKSNITGVTDYRPPSPAEAVKNLPADYSAIKRSIPKLGPPLKGELGPAQIAFNDSHVKETEEEKLVRELRLTRLKQASLARSSDVSFAGLNLSTFHRKNESEESDHTTDSIDSGIPFSSTPASNARDEDNRQDDKNSFLYSSRLNPAYLNQALISPISSYQLMAGTLISGVLLTGINSDLPGQIIGQVSQNVFDTVSGKYLLLPQGTKILGEYDSRIVYGQERVLVVWTRLILPSGKSVSLEGMPGIDLSGYSGLKDRVNNHYLRLLSGVLFGSLLGAGAQIANGSHSTLDPTFSQLALEGAAQNINQAGQQITKKNLNVQPTIEISPGNRFNVFVTKDVILEPYNFN